MQQMVEEGKYVYCIIGTDEARNFGPIGIGGRGDEVTTVSYQDLSAVVSNASMARYVANRDNMVAHERVIEEVMKDYTVLPVRFCTIAAGVEEVRSLLRKRSLELKNLLKDMDNKIELGVRALWNNMDVIFQEIVRENETIRKLKERIAAKPPGQTYHESIALGEMVKSALDAKKEKEGAIILNALKKIAFDFRLNRLVGDRMVLNGAFLVDKGREKEFDDRVEELACACGQRMQLKYVGPTPPFNFVNIVVRWN